MSNYRPRGPRDMIANRAGTCTVCGLPFHKDRLFHWQGPGRGCHIECKGQSAPTQPHHTEKEYLFADPVGSSRYDQLFLDSPEQAASKALQIAADIGVDKIVVARKDDDKFVLLFAIHVPEPAKLYPKPVVPSISIPNNGILFEMPDGTQPADIF